MEGLRRFPSDQGLFAVEADCLDLGSQTGPQVCTVCCLSPCRYSAHSDAQAFAGYALGFLPIPVHVYGKAGFARWKLNRSARGVGTLRTPFVAFSNRGTQFARRVGAQAHKGKIGGRRLDQWRPRLLARGLPESVLGVSGQD